MKWMEDSASRLLVECHGHDLADTVIIVFP